MDTHSGSLRIIYARSREIDLGFWARVSPIRRRARFDPSFTDAPSIMADQMVRPDLASNDRNNFRVVRSFARARFDSPRAPRRVIVSCVLTLTATSSDDLSRRRACKPSGARYVVAHRSVTRNRISRIARRSRRGVIGGRRSCGMVSRRAIR